MGVYTLLSSSIDSKELFLSSAFRIFLEDTTNNILRRNKKGKVDIHVVCESDDKTARTNGKSIYINYNFYVINSLDGKLLKFKFIRGFNGHELGHVLFDDFVVLKKVKAMWKSGIMYPLSNHIEKLSEKQRNNYEEIKKIIERKDEASDCLLKTFLHLDNILSDSFVNYQVKEKVRTYRDDLSYTLKNMKTRLDGYNDIRSKKSSSEKILLYVHYYSVYNTIFDTDDELVQDVIRISPLLDKIKTEMYGETRTCYYQVILCELWNYLKDYFESPKSNGDKQEQNGDGSSEESNDDGSLSESKQDDEGDTSSSDTSNQSTRKGSSGTDIDNNSINELRDIIEKLSGFTTECPDLDSFPRYNEEDESIFENVELKEKVSAEDIQSALATCNNVGSTDETLDSERVDNNFERFLRSYEKECEYREKEEQHNKELKEFRDRISFENHKNLTTAILRQIDVLQDDIKEYERSYKKDVDRISKQIADDVKEKLSKRNSNSLAGFYSGKRINYPAVIRKEMKVFERNNCEDNQVSAAFMLLCDESGSTIGERNYYIRLSSMIFLSVAEQLKIPVGVIGHKAETSYREDNIRVSGNVLSESKMVSKQYADVILDVYADFEHDDKDKYRIVSSMNPSGCNRDGYAITYACERLLQRKEKNKICIILTDGKPNAKNYSGFFAKKDCKTLYEKYKKEGIMLVVAAIGDDKKNIKEIYEDAFLDVKSPKNIPKIFSQILKELYKI